MFTSARRRAIFLTNDSSEVDGGRVVRRGRYRRITTQCCARNVDVNESGNQFFFSDRTSISDDLITFPVRLPLGASSFEVAGIVGRLFLNISQQTTVIRSPAALCHVNYVLSLPLLLFSPFASYFFSPFIFPIPVYFLCSVELTNFIPEMKKYTAIYIVLPISVISIVSFLFFVFFIFFYIEIFIF